MLLSLLTTGTAGTTRKRSALQVAERCFQGIPMLSCCFVFFFSFLLPPSPLPAPSSLTHFPFFPLVFPPLLVFPLSPLLPPSPPSSLSPLPSCSLYAVTFFLPLLSLRSLPSPPLHPPFRLSDVSFLHFDASASFLLSVLLQPRLFCFLSQLSGSHLQLYLQLCLHLYACLEY